MQQNTLIKHTQDFLYEHWDVIYMKYMIGGVDITNLQEQNIMDYYQTLLNLYNVLLKINVRQNDLNLYGDAAYYIDILKRNPTFDNVLPLSQDISDIERSLSKSANLLIYPFIFQAVVITPGFILMTAFALIEALPSPKTDTAFSNYLLLSMALLCIGTTCIAQPMYSTVKQTFFEYLNNHQVLANQPNNPYRPI